MDLLTSPYTLHIQEAEKLFHKVIPPRLKAFLLSLKSPVYTHKEMRWTFYGFEPGIERVLINTGDRDFKGFNGVELAESGIGEFLFIVPEKDRPDHYEDKIYHFIYDDTAWVSGILYPGQKSVNLTIRFFGVDEEDRWVEAADRGSLEQLIGA